MLAIIVEAIDASENDGDDVHEHREDQAVESGVKDARVNETSAAADNHAREDSVEESIETEHEGPV